MHSSLSAILLKTVNSLSEVPVVWQTWTAAPFVVCYRVVPLVGVEEFSPLTETETEAAYHPDLLSETIVKSVDQ